MINPMVWERAFLGGQAVTFIGGVLAGVMAGLLGNNPRPVIAAAGCLTLLTVAVAWFAGVAIKLTGD
jgi:hypothetical protein